MTISYIVLNILASVAIIGVAVAFIFMIGLMAAIFVGGIWGWL